MSANIVTQGLTKYLAQSCDIPYSIVWQKWRNCSNWLILKFFLPCVPHLAIACLLDLIRLCTILQYTWYALILSVLGAFSIIARIHGLNLDGSGLTPLRIIPVDSLKAFLLPLLVTLSKVSLENLVSKHWDHFRLFLNFNFIDLRETSTCCSTHPCIYWLTPACVLTRDQTQNLGALGWRSKQLSYLGRAIWVLYATEPTQKRESPDTSPLASSSVLQEIPWPIWVVAMALLFSGFRLGSIIGMHQ